MEAVGSSVVVLVFRKLVMLNVITLQTITEGSDP